MHPVVIMSYDKSPAITKAVAALEEAGMEVRVLNTNTAKLADFLGALAGEDDEEVDDGQPADIDATKGGAPEDEAPEPEEEEPLATEALAGLVNGEAVLVEVVDGESVTLHSSSISAGAKTFYRLNESEFSFWPDQDKSTQEAADAPVQGGVEVSINGEEHYIRVAFSTESMNPPVLKIGRDWLREAKYPQNSWAMLPAGKDLFSKTKVSLDDIVKEWPDTEGVTLFLHTKNGENKGLVMSPGAHHDEGTSSSVHHDQTFRNIGEFTVVGALILHDGEWKLDSKKKIPGLETPEQIKKFKAPLYVFK